MAQTSRIPVAQYIRMSTDSQQYSIANQKAAIEAYADDHGFAVVSTYADPGKSGVAIKHRPELLRLIHDVTSGHADYKAILVYDVSRWGRFQDVDEAAHYEYLCKSAGVPVRYCAEQFENDGSLPNAMMKALKRTMAAEYSRELGDKVSAGQRRLSLLGFRVVGDAGYGMRRMTVSPDGHRKIILQAGERKGIKTDRTILVPGPKREVDCIQAMFGLATGRTMKNAQAIANELNRRHMLRGGKTWDEESVYRILKNQKYVGSNIYGMTTRRLCSRVKKIDPKSWVTNTGAFVPLVTLGEFKRAQSFLHRRAKLRNRSNAYILHAMKMVLAKHGKLSQRLLKRKHIYDYKTNYARFGSISRAYELAGYQLPTKVKKAMQTQHRSKLLRNDLYVQLEKLFPEQVKIVRLPGQGEPIVEIDGKLRIAVYLCRTLGTTLAGESGCALRVRPKEKDLLALICVMNPSCSKLLSFRVFPPFGLNFLKARRLRPNQPWFLASRELASLGDFCKVAKEVASRCNEVRQREAVDDILLSLDTWRVELGNKKIGLGPINYTVLRLLLRNAGKVVNREQLSRCFPGRVLSGDNIRFHIGELRFKLGASVRKRIRSVPGGWRAPGGYMYKPSGKFS